MDPTKYTSTIKSSVKIDLFIVHILLLKQLLQNLTNNYFVD